jgi:hypothetical protein
VRGGVKMNERHLWARDVYQWQPEQRQEVHDQLPRELRQRLSLTINSVLRTVWTGTAPIITALIVAEFIDRDGRKFDCVLEERANNKLYIPEAFILHLCAVV